MEQKVILLHGFSTEEAVAAMRAIKGALPAAREAAFATTTETNLEWKVSELLDHVSEEHRAMTGRKG
jgi:hypothetical protein